LIFINILVLEINDGICNIQGIYGTKIFINKTNPMAKNLVIVESPAKSETIKKILGSDFEVKASY
jgi:reverse gyrase